MAPSRDARKGTPFTAEGYNRKANAEGAGSEWAPAWGGTYYAYNSRRASYKSLSIGASTTSVDPLFSSPRHSGGSLAGYQAEDWVPHGFVEPPVTT